MKKNIIVTGGAHGIGKAITLELLDKNYSVSVFDINTEAIDEFSKETNQKDVRFYKIDISNEADVNNSISDSFAHFGNIYGLINNAAIHANKPITDLSLAEWNRVLGTNLTSVFLCSKHAAEYLKISGGRIINVASTRALQSEANTEAYSASKGGILSLTHALAVSLGPEIKVNAISPGWIDVSALKKTSVAKQVSISTADHLQHPAGRVGKPEDIANMVLFLLQTENHFITGQNFIIDGGMTKKMIYL